MGKKLLSLLLAMLMVFSFGATAFAEETEDELSPEMEAFMDAYMDFLTAMLEMDGIVDAETGEVIATEDEIDAFILVLKGKLEAVVTAFGDLSDEEKDGSEGFEDIMDQLDAMLDLMGDMLKDEELAAEYDEAFLVVSELLMYDPEELTAEDIEDVEALIEEYEALNADVLDVVLGILALMYMEDMPVMSEHIEALEAAIAALKAADGQEAADKVIALIAAIGTVTKDSKAKIEAARAAYDALSAAEQALVTNLDVLTAAEAAFDALSKGTENPASGVGTPIALFSLLALAAATVVLTRKKVR